MAHIYIDIHDHKDAYMCKYMYVARCVCTQMGRDKKGREEKRRQENKKKTENRIEDKEREEKRSKKQRREEKTR